MQPKQIKDGFFIVIMKELNNYGKAWLLEWKEH